MPSRVVVLGAGAAGLAAANRLALRAQGSEVVVVDRSGNHVYLAGSTSVMFGDLEPEAVVRPLPDLLAPGIRLVRGEVTAIDPQASQVRGTFGEIEYDYLVVALGVELGDLPADEGARVCSPWTVDGALRCRDLVAGIGPGTRVAVTVAGLPYRCPPAPFDLALRIRHATGARVAVAHPWPRPLAPFGPQAARVFEALFASRGVEYIGEFRLERIGVSHLVGEGGAEVAADLAVVVPAHLRPAPLEGSGLQAASGWMEVAYPTLRHPRYRNVFGIGDVIAPPLRLGMAGTLGVFEGGHVADVIAAELSGVDRIEAPVAPRLGAICFMHMGDVGSFMYCDFSPVVEGGEPVCTVMPELPFFLRARSLFAEDWFGSMVRGEVR